MEGGVGVIGKRTKMALHGIFDNNGRLREGSKVLGDFLVKLHESLKLDVLLLESFTWSTFYLMSLQWSISIESLFASFMTKVYLFLLKNVFIIIIIRNSKNVRRQRKTRKSLKITFYTK